MAININRLHNANIYVEGNSMLGKAEEITLPAVKAKFADVKVLGLQSDLEFVTGFEKMSGKIKWNAIYPEMFQHFGSPYITKQVQVRANLETYDSSGRTNQVPVVAFLTVRFKDVMAAMTLKSGDNPDQESEYSCTYYRMEIDGVRMLEIDALTNVYFVQDIDQMVQYRISLGF